MALPRTVLTHLATHHSVVSRRRLREFGLSDRRIDARLADGTLERVHRGVYRLAGSTATSAQALAAACAFDDRIVVSHRSAGRLWGWRKMGSDDEVSVLVPGIANPALCGVTVHRCHRIDDLDWIERDDGIRMTSPARTVFDLARVLSDRALESVIEQALDRQQVNVPLLYATGRRLRVSGREGSARFARVLDQRPAWRAPVGSDLELRVERALVARGLPVPVRQHRVVLRDGTRVRLDLCWPDLGVAVEVDHVTWHGGRIGAQRDKWRDRQVRRSSGIHTVRVTDEDVRDRFGATIDDIADEVTTRLRAAAATDVVAKPSQNGQTRRSRPAQNGVRSSRLRTLPEPVFGSSSTKVTERGIL